MFHIGNGLAERVRDVTAPTDAEPSNVREAVTVVADDDRVVISSRLFTVGRDVPTYTRVRVYGATDDRMRLWTPGKQY